MSRRLRIGVLAGEASGDILGSRVLAALKAQYDEVIVEGIGGPLMQAEGLDSMFPMERLSVMGLVEPLKRLPELLRIRATVFKHFRENPPDLFLGIDSPDFNLQLELKLRRIGVPTAHLVSPSVWAWRQRRIKKIKRAVDLMLCLFPFETGIYQQHGIAVRFVGHPLADEIPQQVDMQAARASLGLAPQGKLLALLPGSRGSEVRLLAPLFLQVAQRLWQADKRMSFVLPAASSLLADQLRRLLQAYPQLPVTLLAGQSREAMAAADTVLLASGTATLEAALLQRPMVVAYRTGALTWLLLSALVKTRYVALPNVLTGKALVPELLQSGANAQAILSAVQPLLAASGAKTAQLREFAAIHEQLRHNYARQAASALVELVASRQGTHY